MTDQFTWPFLIICTFMAWGGMLYTLYDIRDILREIRDSLNQQRPEHR